MSELLWRKRSGLVTSKLLWQKKSALQRYLFLFLRTDKENVFPFTVRHADLLSSPARAGLLLQAPVQKYLWSYLFVPATIGPGTNMILVSGPTDKVMEKILASIHSTF